LPQKPSVRAGNAPVIPVSQSGCYGQECLLQNDSYDITIDKDLIVVEMVQKALKEVQAFGYLFAGGTIDYSSRNYH
jgi:hypothetical protein